MQEVVDAIESAAPAVAGRVFWEEGQLPFPEALEGTCWSASSARSAHAARRRRSRHDRALPRGNRSRRSRGDTKTWRSPIGDLANATATVHGGRVDHLGDLDDDPDLIHFVNGGAGATPSRDRERRLRRSRRLHPLRRIRLLGRDREVERPVRGLVRLPACERRASDRAVARLPPHRSSCRRRDTRPKAREQGGGRRGGRGSGGGSASTRVSPSSASNASSAFTMACARRVAPRAGEVGAAVRDDLRRTLARLQRGEMEGDVE